MLFAYLAMDDFCLIGKYFNMAENRIKELREARGMTLEQLAEEVGLSVSYVQRLESGERNLAVKHFDAFAAALKVVAKDLLRDDAESSPSVERQTVRVVGRIGAGAEILPDTEQVPPEGLFEIEIPFPVPENAVAFEVSGDSMWPRYDDKDVVLCWREGTNASEIIGWEAAVKTSDGKRYLKRIVSGSKARLYNLESFNAPVIRDVKLDWVSKVQLVVRAGEWKQLGRSVQRRIMKKLATTK